MNGSLTKAGVRYESLWSRDFTDQFFLNGLSRWLRGENIPHDSSHVHALRMFQLPAGEEALAREVSETLRRDKAILGVFDEGCMGMYNAIIPDELLHPTGVFKERLSQSALYAEMQRTSDAEARAVRAWLDKSGMHFVTGPNPETDLTDDQILDQCKMYISALRIAGRFRLRCHRDSISARAQRPDAGIRSRGGSAQQRGAAAGAFARRPGTLRRTRAPAFQ